MKPNWGSNIDILLVEVFDDLTAANSTPIPHPNPGGHVPIPEPASVVLSLTAAVAATLCRRRP